MDKTDEYDLQEAGAFSVVDLLDFREAELEKGNIVRKVWLTKLQANHLANDAEGVKPKLTGKKLVDYWNAPRNPIKIESIHGIEIGVEE